MDPGYNQRQGNAIGVSYKRTLLYPDWLFSVPPPPNCFWKTSENIITNRFEYKPENFSFKLILKVIVKDSDTNFVHTFSLNSHAFLMKKINSFLF